MAAEADLQTFWKESWPCFTFADGTSEPLGEHQHSFSYNNVSAELL